MYKIILQLTDNKTAAFIAGIAGVLNLTTVFFGYMIISETLALFLFTLTSWLLLKYLTEERLFYSAASGIVAGLLVLTRFNTLGLPLVVAILFMLVPLLRRKKFRLKSVFSCVALFVSGVLLILNFGLSEITYPTGNMKFYLNITLVRDGQSRRQLVRVTLSAVSTRRYWISF